MKRIRRFFRLVWVAQLAFVVLALPAAHVHRHAPGASCGGGCSVSASHAAHSHRHGSCSSHERSSACSHASSCCGERERPEGREIVRAPGERTLEKPGHGGHVHCAACELQRLIGHAFAFEAEAPSIATRVESIPDHVATCCGRAPESRGCRGPPAAC